MFRTTLVAISMAFIFITPLQSLAINQDQQAGTEKSTFMGHDSHDAMQLLGECVRSGVKARATIKSYDREAIRAMKDMGMEGTHHLMVFFSNSENGMGITDGLVAVKIKAERDKEPKPLKLMPMAEGFGADIVLPANGEYEFVIGSKLKDGKRRQFEFFYLNF